MPRLAVLCVVLAASAVAWLYWRGSQAAPLIVSGFIEADAVRVGSRVGGRVADVLVNEGQRVRSGDLLYRLDPFDLRQRLAEAEAQLSAHQAEHDRLKAGYRPEEIAQAKARRDQAAATLEKLVAGPRPREIAIARERLKITQADLDLAESEHERVTRLRAEASAAETEFDQAVRELKRARAAVATAEQELALLEEGTRAEEVAETRAAHAHAEQALLWIERGFRAEDVAAAAAQAAAAQARVAAIQTQMTELNVLSPCDCVVEAIDLHPGDLVSANAPSLTLLDLSRLWVRTYVPELQLGQVSPGKKVSVRVDSFPDRWFAGHVTVVASDGEFTPRNVQTPEERGKQVFRVKVALQDGLDVLRVGMGADVLLSEAVIP